MSKKQKLTKTSITELALNIGTDAIVRIKRKRIDKHPLYGFAVTISRKLLVLHQVDGSTLQLNGYSAVRIKDITAWRRDNTFKTLALRQLKRAPDVPTDIDPANWSTLIASAQQKHPLLSIEAEAWAADCAFIGRVQKQHKDGLTWLEVDTEGHWRTYYTSFSYKDITLVEFGDGYTETLSAYVN